MPNRALGLPACALLLRSAQRSDRRIEAAASLSLAGKGVHSSKIMAMSELRLRWMRIDSSGVSSMRSPLTGEAKCTPSSVIFLSFPRLNTWNPPESVRIGPLHPIKRCRPPCAAIVSSPGRSHR